MEHKILSFQFEPLSVKLTHPSYNNGSNQDEPQKQPPKVFCKKGSFRNFAKFTGKHLCQSLFFNKVAGLNPAKLLKKRLWHRWFPVNFAKFLIKPFLQNISGQLLWEPEAQHNRLSSQEWCNCQNCCHEIPEVKAFHLKGKARLSWNTADLEFTEAIVRRCFSK